MTGPHRIEILLGPCTREQTEDVCIRLSGYLDEHFPALGAAVAADFRPDRKNDILDLVGATVAARILKVESSHVKRYRDRGELPAIVVEGTHGYAYRRGDVEALAEVIRERREKAGKSTTQAQPRRAAR